MADRKISQLQTINELTDIDAIEVQRGNDNYKILGNNFLRSQNDLSEINTELKKTNARNNLGLSNVDNTSDIDKPISTLTQEALDLKVDKVAGKELSTNDLTDDLKKNIKESVVAVKFISDLSTISEEVLIEGKLAFVLENKKYYKYNGTSWEIYFGELPFGELFYIDPNTGDDILGNGSYDTPFKTPEKAIPLCSPGGASAIMLMDSFTNATPLTITTGDENIQFIGLSSTTDSQVVKWIQQIILTGNTTRIRFVNIQHNHGTEAPILDQSTGGRLYWENCTFTRNGGDNDKVYIATGNNYRWREFYRCNFSGTFSMEGSPSSYCDFRFTGIGDFGMKFNMQGTTDNYTVRCMYMHRLSYVNHERGAFECSYLNEASGSGGYFINSIAPTSIKNRLILKYCNLKKNDSGIYAKINKTGNCIYEIDYCSRDVANDILTGTRRSYGANSVDIQNNSNVEGSSLVDAINNLLEYISTKEINATLTSLQDKIIELILPTSIKSNFFISCEIYNTITLKTSYMKFNIFHKNGEANGIVSDISIYNSLNEEIPIEIQNTTTLQSGKIGINCINLLSQDLDLIFYLN